MTVRYERGQTWEAGRPHRVSQQDWPLQSQKRQVVAGQDVAVLGVKVPAWVDEDVLNLVAWRHLHLCHISQAEVDGDHVRVEAVTTWRTGAVPR